MAGSHGKRSRRSQNRKTAAESDRSKRGRRRVFGVGPEPVQANAQAANADVLDAILDPIINSLGSVDPTLAGDLGQPGLQL